MRSSWLLLSIICVFVTSAEHTATAFITSSRNQVASRQNVRLLSDDSQSSVVERTAAPQTKTMDEDNADPSQDFKNSEKEEVLSCRILGFYPFPTAPPDGPLGWIFRDTHQAIVVQSSSQHPAVLIDFMTKGGEFHPVWYNEAVKWNVFFGGTIQGEIRVRFLKAKKGRGQYDDSPKMERLLQIARSYDCNMNLYGNNCRIFCARMEREVERLNNSDSEIAADFRCAKRVVGAALLPALYPLFALLLCYGGLHDLW